MFDEWVLDSGCSFHMCLNKNMFTNFDEKESDVVYMGNQNACKIQGIGNITLKMHDGKIRLLTDVRFMSDLKRNLISLGTLDKIGFSYNAKNGCLHVSKNGNIVLTSTKRNGLYILDSTFHAATKFDSALVSSYNITELWHLRLSHMSQKELQISSQQSLLGKAPMTTLDFCQMCVLASNTK